jgi:RNA polymerase sigma factor (sigma-70 family)
MQEFIKNIINGNKDAWILFIKEFHPVIKSVINRFGRLSVDDRADVYQLVFEEIIKNDYKVLRNFKGERTKILAKYLKTITHRLCIRRYNQNKKKNNVDIDNIQIADEKSSNDKMIDNQSLEDTMWKAINELDKKYRDPLLLLLKQRKTKEIAKILGLEIKTVETHILRAKEILKKNKFLKEFFDNKALI